MSEPPLHPAAERFASLLDSLAAALVRQAGWGVSFIVAWIMSRHLLSLRDSFAALAASIEDGANVPPRAVDAPGRQPGRPAEAPRNTLWRPAPSDRATAFPSRGRATAVRPQPPPAADPATPATPATPRAAPCRPPLPAGWRWRKPTADPRPLLRLPPPRAFARPYRSA